MATKVKDLCRNGRTGTMIYRLRNSTDSFNSTTTVMVYEGEDPCRGPLRRTD